MSNKESAKTFLALASSGDVRAAYERFTSPTFKHHNVYFPGDRQSLLDAMLAAAKSSPNASFEVKRAVEEGDLVFTHSRVVRKDPAAQHIAVVHIFRFEGGKIAELWDVGQLLPKDSPNANGPF